MLPTLKLFIVSALAVLLNFPADLVAQVAKKPMKICVNETNELNVRARCKKGETILTGSALDQKLKESMIEVSSEQVGPIGPVGPLGAKGQAGNAGVKGEKGLIDFTGCRKYSPPAEDNTNGSVDKLTISASCVPGVEFIYDDEYNVSIFNNSVGTKVVVQSRSIDSNNGDNRDYFVEYTMNRIVSAGLGLYSAQLLVLCCPL